MCVYIYMKTEIVVYISRLKNLHYFLSNKYVKKYFGLLYITLNTLNTVYNNTPINSNTSVYSTVHLTKF